MGLSDGRRGLHWFAWDTLCDRKVVKRLGFRSLQEFDKVLLATQMRCLFQNPSCLAARILKEKYFATGSILQAESQSNASFFLEKFDVKEL